MRRWRRCSVAEVKDYVFNGLRDYGKIDIKVTLDQGKLWIWVFSSSGFFLLPFIFSEAVLKSKNSGWGFTFLILLQQRSYLVFM